jgi:hypothetical protein
MKQLLTLLTTLLLAPLPLKAWGDAHRSITLAALEVVPEKDRWIAMLGAENWQHIGGIDETTGYCGIADNQSEYLRRPWCEFFSNDYLLTRDAPFLHGYHVPVIEEPEWNRQIAAFARRALQALRTESPVEAARRVGVLLHFCQDAGATAHAARISPPAHTLLDNTVPLERIVLRDNRPQLLGKTDEEFITALQQKIAVLIALNGPVGARLKPEAVALAPVYKAPPDDASRARLAAVAEAQVSPALECVRVTADTLHTLMTLGLGSRGDGAALNGTLEWAPLSSFEKSGAEVHLLDAARLSSGTLTPERLYAACTGYNTHTEPAGRFTFHNLPAGEYRVLAYRVGSTMQLSEPVKITRDRPATISISLKPSVAERNLVYNPTLQLTTYAEGMPDRWMALKPLNGLQTFMSAPVPVASGKTLRLGVKLRDHSARVTFFVLKLSDKGAIAKCSRTMRIDPTFESAAEFSGEGGETTAPSPVNTPGLVLIHAVTSLPLSEAIENVWVIEEGERK